MTMKLIAYDLGTGGGSQPTSQNAVEYAALQPAFEHVSGVLADLGGHLARRL